MGYGYQDAIAEIFVRYARSFWDVERGTSMYEVFLNLLLQIQERKWHYKI